MSGVGRPTMFRLCLCGAIRNDTPGLQDFDSLFYSMDVVFHSIFSNYQLGRESPLIGDFVIIKRFGNGV